MGSIEDDWFEPRRLFDSGYPEGLSSAARELPTIRKTLRDEVLGLAPATLLEIGPGDAPVADGLPGATFMDVVRAFLAPLHGLRVVGDLMCPPFLPGSFDLVIACDLLTHVRPALRRQALGSMAALGRDMIYFCPEPGTWEVEFSPVSHKMVRAYFDDHGYALTIRRFTAMGALGEYAMYLLTARRG